MQILLPNHEYQQNTLNDMDFCICGVAKRLHITHLTNNTMNTKDIEEEFFQKFSEGKNNEYWRITDEYEPTHVPVDPRDVANWLCTTLTTLTQHHEAEVKKAVGTERWNIGAWIEQQDFARKEGERSGDPASVWAVQTVIKQINQYLQALTPTTPDKQYPDVPCAHGVNVNEDCTDCGDSMKKLKFKPASEGLSTNMDNQ